jgi:WD40 repeat protein
MKTVIGLIAVSVALAGCSTPGESVSKTPVWQAFPSQPNNYYINSVAVSGDGTKTVGGTFFHSYGCTTRYEGMQAKSTASSSNGTFGTYCYDQTGRQLWKDEFTGYEGVYWVDISTDGAYAASGGWFSGSPNYAGFVRAFDANTGQRLLDYRTTSRVNQVVLSADGQWLVSAAESVVLFKLVNGVYQKTGEFMPGTANDSITTIDMSADGNWMIYGDYSGNLVLLANKGGLPVLWKQTPVPSGGGSHCVRMTPDGAAFAAGGSQGNFYLYDVSSFISTGQPAISYQIPNTSSVYGVAIADDASAVVGISNQNTTSGLVSYVKRSGAQGALQWTFATTRNPNCASINLAGGILAISDGHPDGTPGNFYLLNTADGSLRWQYTTGNMSWPIMISASGNAVVAGSDDSNIYYFSP